MHGGGFGERARQVGAQHPHQLNAVERRAEQRGMHGIGERLQVLRGALAAGDDHARKARHDQLMKHLLARHRVERIQMVDFRTREYLNPVGVDEVKVPDQTFLGIFEVAAVEQLYAAVAPRDPLEAQLAAVVVKQLRYADSRHSAATLQSTGAWRRRTGR